MKRKWRSVWRALKTKEAESGVFYSVRHISIQPPFTGGSSPYFRTTPTFRRPLSWLRPLRPLCKGSHSWQLTKRHAPDKQEGEKRPCVFLWTIQSVPQLAGHERLVHLFCASQRCTEALGSGSNRPQKSAVWQTKASFVHGWTLTFMGVLPASHSMTPFLGPGPVEPVGVTENGYLWLFLYA